MTFVTIEGGEGSGKSTLISGLEDVLIAQGCNVVRTREPGGAPLSEYIRKWILERHQQMAIGSMAELLLFLAGRAQHLEELIVPALAAGKVVLCDRFNDSTVAYQGGARGLGVGFVQQLCDMVCNNVVPDLTIYLDIEPRKGLERSVRVHKAEAPVGEKDRIESEGLLFHDKVRQEFLAQAKRYPQRIRVLDATLPKEEILEQAIKLLEYEARIHRG